MIDHGASEYGALVNSDRGEKVTGQPLPGPASAVTSTYSDFVKIVGSGPRIALNVPRDSGTLF
jgi:hypothetical protein